MSNTPRLLEAYVEPETETAPLRRRIAQLESDLQHTREELRSARRECDSLAHGMKALRKTLQPLHNALRVVFGELDAAGVDGEVQVSGGNQKWEAIKLQMAPRLAQAVDLLLLQGHMRRTQIASALKMNYTNCCNNVITILLRQGWCIERGGEISLKEL